MSLQIILYPLDQFTFNTNCSGSSSKLISALGVVEEVTLSPAKTYASTADGKWNLAPKDGYNCVEVSAIVDAQEFQHGIIVNAAKYGIGHSLTIRVGKAKIYGRVSGLEKIN